MERTEKATVVASIGRPNDPVKRRLLVGASLVFWRLKLF